MLPELPPSLQLLLDTLEGLLIGLLERLRQGFIGVQEWRTVMESLLTRYHLTAYMLGQDSSEMRFDDLAKVQGYIDTQLTFLENFSVIIQTSPEWDSGWQERARMYAQGIKAPYWAAQTKVLPLPAMPGDGTTQCLTNCRCLWDVHALDEEAGDYDAFWVLGAAEHCQTCVERASQWAPLRIRDGRVIIPMEILG